MFVISFVVVVELVEVGDRALAHLGVDEVQVLEQLVQLGVEIEDVEAEAAGLAARDRVLVGGIGTS